MADRTTRQGTLQEMGGKGNLKHGGKMASAKESASKVATSKGKKSGGKATKSAY